MVSSIGIKDTRNKVDEMLEMHISNFKEIEERISKLNTSTSFDEVLKRIEEQGYEGLKTFVDHL